jgi:hypothetical protein
VNVHERSETEYDKDRDISTLDKAICDTAQDSDGDVGENSSGGASMVLRGRKAGFGSESHIQSFYILRFRKRFAGV